jgi:chromosome segregation ATPase
MTTLKEATEISKNFLDIVKSAFILTIVAVLIFFSDVVNNLFDRYNVLQLEFGGLKMDRSEAIKRLKENADQLPILQGQIAAAKQQLGDLQNQYSEATKAIEGLKKERDAAVERLRVAGAPAPESTVEVQKVLAAQNQALSIVQETKRLLENAATTTAAAVENLPSDTPTGSARFAIIFGGYPTNAAALDAAARSNRGNAVVYLRQGAFRTALQYSSEAAASADLSEARKLSAQAYVVNLASWCPKPVSQGDKLLDCRL